MPAPAPMAYALLKGRSMAKESRSEDECELEREGGNFMASDIVEPKAVARLRAEMSSRGRRKGVGRRIRVMLTERIMRRVARAEKEALKFVSQVM